MLSAKYMQGDRSHTGWQALVHALGSAAALPALRWVELDAGWLEEWLDAKQLKAFISTISQCSRLLHLHLCRSKDQVWGSIFDGLSAVEHITLALCKFDVVPDTLKRLTTLQELHLLGCSGLTSLHEYFAGRSSPVLQVMTVDSFFQLG